MTNDVQKIKEFFASPATFVFPTPKLSWQRKCFTSVSINGSKTALNSLAWLWGLCTTSRDTSRCPAQNFPGCFFALQPATFPYFPLKASVHTHFRDWLLPLMADNATWLVTLNTSSSLRSQFIHLHFLHHFLHPTARIFEGKSCSVFNGNVLLGFSAL